MQFSQLKSVCEYFNISISSVRLAFNHHSVNTSQQSTVNSHNVYTHEINPCSSQTQVGCQNYPGEVYSPDDIFNCDETGVFFRMQPNRSYVGKGDDCHGGKNSKERITIMPCPNMTGSEKVPSSSLGNLPNPDASRVLPSGYKVQRRAWMNGDH